MLKTVFQFVQRTFLRVRNALPRRVWIILLIVLVIFSGSWLLFFHSSSAARTLGASAPIGALGPATTITAQKNGIEESMQITSGPYFLSELLEARLTLTNHNKTPFEVQGLLTNAPCTGGLGVDITGGTLPQYNIPANNAFMSCPPPMPSTLKPGQTVSILQNFPLTMSGPMTLTFGVRFMHLVKNKQDNQNMNTNFDPLDGHTPALHTIVFPRVPTDRVLSVQWIGSQVHIDAPDAAQANFRYYYTCSNFVPVNGEWTRTGNFSWQSFTQSFLSLPMCSGLVSQWQFAVGAPGFSVATGSTSF